MRWRRIFIHNVYGGFVVFLGTALLGCPSSSNGTVEVTILPEGAVAAAAGWQLDGTS